MSYSSPLLPAGLTFATSITIPQPNDIGVQLKALSTLPHDTASLTEVP